MEPKKPEYATARKLVNHFGSVRKTAEAFQLKAAYTVRLWLTRGIPHERLLDVEHRSGGAVTADEILREAKERIA